MLKFVVQTSNLGLVQLFQKILLSGMCLSAFRQGELYSPEFRLSHGNARILASGVLFHGSGCFLQLAREHRVFLGETKNSLLIMLCTKLRLPLGFDQRQATGVATSGQRGLGLSELVLKGLELKSLGRLVLRQAGMEQLCLLLRGTPL